MKICPNCQHENEADNVFCENCGADLTHIDSAERT
ncbi:zinc-ribbon domain-containing protein [Lactiplantibacillus plantarum]|nr:zinc-ribbon domain-containing protein [Lactiplantibacillus plantarum]